MTYVPVEGSTQNKKKNTSIGANNWGPSTQGGEIENHIQIAK